MYKILHIFRAIILIFHGLIHLMGTIVYMKLGSLEGFPYKTTILNGQIDLGANGMSLFGGLWALAALGFMLAALNLMLGWKVRQPLLVSVTLFSLVLTSLDWEIAFAGAIINLVILTVLMGNSLTRSLRPRQNQSI